MPLLALAAFLAGALTTLSGFGGGILLLLACTAALGAKPALAVTSIVLLAGNIHRVWLYRADVRAPVTVPLLVGVVPGSLLGGLTAAAIPERAVHAIMIAVVGASLAHAWGRWTWRPGPRALFAAGLVIGVLAGSSGGAGFLIGPLALAAGLAGRRYLATIATTAVAMHAARILGYGAGGLVTAHVLSIAAVLGPALLAGNLLGDRVRDRVPERWYRRIELAAPVVCVALALGGLA